MCTDLQILLTLILTLFHVFDGHPAAVLRYLQQEQARRGRIHAAVYAMLQVWHLLPALIHCTSTLHLYLTPAGDCVYGGEQEFERSGRDSGNLRSLVTTYII